MKYFNNITTPEELKKQFRALSIKLHPDRGGNAEDFKKMMAEYMAISKDFDRAKEQAEAEAEARRQAEEYRKQQEEERKREEEEARKAAEALRPIVEKWAAELEQVPAATDYRNTKSEKAAYTAAVKRNLKRVFSHYFKGVKVSVSICTRTWKEETVITWQDGPTVAEVEALAEWSYFTANSYQSDPYSDYGDFVELKGTREWRKAYGESYEQIKFKRTFSEAAKAEALRTIAQAVPAFENCDKLDEQRKATTNQLADLFRICYPNAPRYRENMTEAERKEYYKYDNIRAEFCRLATCANVANVYLSTLLRLMLENWKPSADVENQTKAEADAPKFTPKHNATYNAILKALGGNAFSPANDSAEWSQRTVIDPAEAAEMLARGEGVELVKPWTGSDGVRKMSGVTAGGHKTQEKRAAKFAAVGFTVKVTYNSYGKVIFSDILPGVLAELRKDAEQVAEQRKAWEAAQRDGKTSTSDAKAETTANDQTDEQPAEGLTLQEIAGGVAVVGDQRTTYRNRKAIKAHGARWNKEAQQWQATTPEAVQRLREWFGVNEPEQTNEQPQAKKEQPQAETKQAETQAEPTAEETERAARFAALLVDVVAMFEQIATAARKEAQRAKKTAHKQAEAEQLRADIAAMSEKVAEMSETLHRMSERLATLEAENGTNSTTAEQTTADKEPQPEEPAQESPERGEGKPDALDMLRATAEDVARLTEANDHTAALLARLYVLAAVGLRVRPLIERAKAIEAAQQRGHLTPDEVSDRQRISQETERRAALLLTPEEFRTLYGYDQKADRKAA